MNEQTIGRRRRTDPARASRISGSGASRLVLLAAALAAFGVSACASETAPALGPTLTLAEQGASRPTAAIDPLTGTVYIAWVGTSNDTSNVYLARLEPGGTSAPEPVRVNQIVGDAAPHDQAPARVVVGADGHVYLAWQNNIHLSGRRFPASDLRFARSTDGGRTFEPTRTVNDDAGGLPASHTFHDMAIAGDGTITVSWIESGESSEIRVASSSDGGRSFGPSRLVDNEACPCCRTALAIGDDGAVYVAWRKIFDGDIRDVVVARADAAESVADGAAVFQAPRRVHADDWHFEACPHAGPAIATDNAGRVHLAWYTGQEGRAGLYHTNSADRTASFAAPTVILASAALPPSQVAVAIDGQDIVWIAWEDRRSAGREVHLARLLADNTIGRTLALPGTAPALAVAGETTAFAWLDGDALRVRIGRPAMVAGGVPNTADRSR